MDSTFDLNQNNDLISSSTGLNRIAASIQLEKELIDNELNSLIYNMMPTFDLKDLKMIYEHNLNQIEQEYDAELEKLNRNSRMDHSGHYHDDTSYNIQRVLQKYEQNFKFLFQIIRQRIEVCLWGSFKS